MKSKPGYYKVIKDNNVISERTLITTLKGVKNLVNNGYEVEEVQ